jgi:hypothetical protein
MWVNRFLNCHSNSSTVATAAASELMEKTLSNQYGGLEIGGIT